MDEHPQTPATDQQADDALDDVLVNRTDHRPMVEHIFFQASQQTSHEQSQAIARIVIVALVDLVLAANVAINGTSAGAALNFGIGIGYLLYSLFHYRWTRRQTQRLDARRHLAIVGDLACTSYVTYLFGLAGLGFYPLYLWIVVGNGLRFGARYLRIATAVGITGFVAATTLDGMIYRQPGIVAGLLVGLILMPKFFLVMIRRLSEANSALRQQKEQAEYLARHDHLTALPNRILAEDRLNLALGRAARSGSRPAVVFIDLDGFKAINDNFGHTHGDMLLKAVADCLKARVRRGDTVARLGGDEFLILIEAANDPPEVAAIVDQIFTCSGRYYQLGEYRTYLTWSCGVAIYPNDGEDGATLIKNADIAMYRAKATGINQFRLYDPAMSEEVSSQLALRDQLRDALETHRFQLLYQPICRYPGARVDTLQAQLYWYRDAHTPVSLDGFDEIIDQAGLSAALANRALTQALTDIARWRRAGLDPQPVMVEVTAQQLANADFLMNLQRLLSDRELPASVIGIAINEPALIKDSQPLAELLDTLHKAGVRIALNHFGTGYAALGFLKRYPVDRITIDPELIAELPDNPSSCTLVEALLAIAERTRMEVVAEGVDNPAQLSWLTAHGCHLMQGACVSAPIAADQLDASMHDGALRAFCGTAGDQVGR